MRITPLLAVAHARTTDEATDVQLKLALRMLLGAHDPLLAVEPFSGNTALHILAAQRRPLIVKHRLKFLVNLMDTASWNSNMLVARNAAGKLPEDVAATHAIWLRLRRHRLSFQEQAALAGDVPHRP